MEDKKIKLKLSHVIIIGIVIAVIIIGIVATMILTKKDVNKQGAQGNIGQNSNNSQVDNNKIGSYTKMVYADEYFDETNPIPVKSNGKYGYIDATNGSVIIEPKYDYAYDFAGQYAWVYNYKDPNSKSLYNNTIDYLIDRQGNVKFSSEEHTISTHLQAYGAYIIDGKLYNLNLEEIGDNNCEYGAIAESAYCTYTRQDENGVMQESGIANALGEKIYVIEGSGYPSFSVLEDNMLNTYAGVKQAAYTDGLYIPGENNFSIIDLLTGKVLYTVEIGERTNEVTNEDTGVYLITLSNTNKASKKLVVLKDNKVVLEKDVNNIDTAYWDDGEEDILCIKYDNKEEYYSISKKKTLDKNENTITTTAMFNQDNLIESGYVVRSANSTHSGLYTKNGEEIIPTEYTNIFTPPYEVYNYLYKKYNKIYVNVSNTDKADFYELVSRKCIEGVNMRGIDFHKDSMLGCFKSDSMLTMGPTVTKALGMINLKTGKIAKFGNPVEVKLEKTYFYIKDGEKATYYNASFQPIYQGESID